MNPASAAPNLPGLPAIRDWLDVCPAPKPYLHVLRRGFRGGPHVLILVRETGGRLRVDSYVDHGTLQGSITNEGFARDAGGLAELLANTCAKWMDVEKSEAGAAEGPRKRYFHTKPGGGISEPVSRDRLFHLLAQGLIPWHCQVWEEVEHIPGSGAWTSLLTALGFPADGPAGDS